jgi:hypothetical protein
MAILFTLEILIMQSRFRDKVKAFAKSIILWNNNWGTNMRKYYSTLKKFKIWTDNKRKRSAPIIFGLI